MTLDLKPGDPWPFRSVRGLTGAPIEPTWYALITAPQREARTKDQLARVDVEVQYPTIDRVRHARGKRYDIVQPMISQIIYARFRYAPNFDVMRERNLILWVLARNGVPCELTDDEISTAMGMPTEEEKIRIAEIERMTPVVGERVKVTDAPLGDYLMDVDRVEFGRVWWSFISGSGLRIKGESKVEKIKRLG